MLRFIFWTLFVPTTLLGQFKQQWIDSVYASMTLDQKVGQLFMVMAYPDGNTQKQKQIEKYILDQHVGGVLFSKGTSEHLQKDMQRYQRFSQIPLFIAADAEWGMAMRLEDVSPYPYAMTLGALSDEDLIYATAKRMGVRKREMGIHISFAPVADVNIETKNPIIGVRAFGDNPNRVARQSTAFMEGLQDAGILAVAKHFPGHGAARLDSHKSLPTINHNKTQLDSIEFVPFRKLIDADVKGIMVGHLRIPAIEKGTIPVSVSAKVVTELLQNKMAFEGLIFTDALNMKGITQYVQSAALEAFLAGADVLVLPQNLVKGISAIKARIIDGNITADRLKHSVKKILAAKYNLGLHKKQFHAFNANALKTTHEDVYLKKQIALKSIVNVHAKPHCFPLKSSSNITYIEIGKPKDDSFFKALQKHTKSIERIALDNIKSTHGKKIIIGFFANTETPWKSINMSQKDIGTLHQLANQNQVFVIGFANPYVINQFPPLNTFSSVLWAHENQPLFAQAAAQILFGKYLPVGVLPVNLKE